VGRELDHVDIAAAIISDVVDSSTSVMRVVLFCTPSLAIFPTCCYRLDSHLANLETLVAVG